MKGNNEKNDLNFERFQIIQEWCIKNFPSISSHVKVKIKNRQNVQNTAKSDQLFENERKDAHMQLKYNLTAYLNKIKSIISSFENNLNNLVSQPIPPLGKTYFDQQKMNLDVRRLLFSQQLMHKLNIKILTIRIDILMSIIEKINKTFELIDKSDDDVIIIIDNHFYEMESEIRLKQKKRATSDMSASKMIDLNQSSPTSSCFSDQFYENFSDTSNMQNKLVYLDSSIVPTSESSSSSQISSPTFQQYYSLLIRLNTYSNRLASRIVNKYPKPLWATDYSLFIEEIVHKSLPRFDFDLSYLLPQECELSINRALFGNTIKTSEPIDVILRSFPKIAPNAFNIELMSMCYKVIPQRILKKFKPEELSISLTFMFRVLFDRVYEKNFESEKNMISGGEAKLSEMIQTYDEKRNKYVQMKKLSMSALVWPQDYLPTRPFVVSHGDLATAKTQKIPKAFKATTQMNPTKPSKPSKTKATTT